MKSKILFITLMMVGGNVFSGCLDDLTTTMVIKSKIRGFYINRNFSSADQMHSVILDKATCVANISDEITLAPTTKNHYYLNFKSDDKALYSMLLSAQAQDAVVEFRIGTPIYESGETNSILYVISPAGARSQ